MTKLNFTSMVALFILVIRLNSYSVIGSKMSRPSLWCDKAQGLSDGQRKLCRKVPGLQTAIRKGIEKGLSECEREFMWNRWNCTLLGEKSLFERAPDNTQEAAFTTALLSAALAYNVALACTEKDVTECSCEEVKRPFREQSTWKWRGCSVNVGFGSYTAERFMLSGYRSNKTKSSIINKHNVRVGLEVLKENRIVKCTVGKRGNAKACRLTLPPLRKISRLIKSKYNKATKVVAIKRRNKQSFFLRTNARHTNRRNFNRPMKSELVFLTRSPSYCYRQDKYRIPGTRGRKCRRNSLKEDDCSLMCCGRGYNRNVLHKKRFCYCSKAAENEQCQCKVCTDVVIENTCL